MALTASAIFRDIEQIRNLAPLIHNITNYVVMNTTANALLAIGASPVMAHGLPEVADMAGIAAALVINIGTLSDTWIEAMFRAASKAGFRGIPIVLDPVGAGATPYRTRTAGDLLRKARPSIIRGNGSEILALCEAGAATRGVDSTSSSDQAVHAAQRLAHQFSCVVCVTGAVDYIVSDRAVIKVNNGHPLMPRVTGLGCSASALCGAFAAVNPDYGMAAAHAMAVMGIAGEMAAETSPGPGSFQVNFIDALYRIGQPDIEQRLKA
ncbi:MAG: hydroxyethylthiazole kinase [Thermodesulfobacteriota bacterium]